jgi:hypothetical protein
MSFMSPSLIESIEVSAVFFVLDVLLVALLLPFILTVREKRKWAPMRRELIKRCYQYYLDCAHSAGYMGFECVGFLYVELCNRCADYHRARTLYAMPLPAGGTPRSVSRYRKEQDLASLAERAEKTQREASSRFERYVNIFSSSIDSEMASAITAVLESGDAVTSSVWFIASCIQQNERDLILNSPPYARTADAYNSFQYTILMYDSLKQMHSSIQQISNAIGGIQFDQGDFNGALSQAREKAEACRRAVIDLFETIGQDPPKRALTPVV